MRFQYIRKLASIYLAIMLRHAAKCMTTLESQKHTQCKLCAAIPFCTSYSVRIILVLELASDILNCSEMFLLKWYLSLLILYNVHGLL